MSNRLPGDARQAVSISGKVNNSKLTDGVIATS
jgi:hypothetical protein